MSRKKSGNIFTTLTSIFTFCCCCATAEKDFRREKRTKFFFYHNQFNLSLGLHRSSEWEWKKEKKKKVFSSARKKIQQNLVLQLISLVALSAQNKERERKNSSRCVIKQHKSSSIHLAPCLKLIIRDSHRRLLLRKALLLPNIVMNYAVKILDGEREEKL